MVHASNSVEYYAQVQVSTVNDYATNFTTKSRRKNERSRTHEKEAFKGLMRSNEEEVRNRNKSF